MSEYRILEAALKKDALREHFCRVSRDRFGLGKIDRATYKVEVDNINERFALTAEEQKALDADRIKRIRRA